METITGTSTVACPMENGSTMCLAGPSRCGKSYTLRQFLNYRNVMFVTPVQRVLYCYSVWTQDFDDMHDVTCLQGLPTLNDIEALTSPKGHSLLILDDLGENMAMAKNRFIDSIFVAHSHHRSVTVLYTLQNLYTKNLRTIMLNTLYYCLWSGPRQTEQTKIFGRQVGLPVFAAYMDLTEPYNFLFVDLTGRCHPLTALRRNIFPGQLMITYA